MEIGIGHLYLKFFPYIIFFGIPIESHMVLPSEIISVRDVELHHLSCNIPFMNEVRNDLFELLS